MLNKTVSLMDMIKLSHNIELSKPYIQYLCGLDKAGTYRHQEILDIKSLLTEVNLPEESVSGFLYGYVVPQLNREFDLLRISQNVCLNIELKSTEIPIEKIKRQLIQNKHFLKLLRKPYLYLFTYISSTNRVFLLSESGDLVECGVAVLAETWGKVKEAGQTIDLDQVFTPNNILVSPLNATERFLAEDYLLTENQENIKSAIVGYICTKVEDRFIGLTGGPGTGKTLLIYDIAHKLAEKNRVLIVHSGILCDGHRELNQRLNNIKIIAAKELRLREIEDVDIVIVDEAHRLYTETLGKIERWVKRTNATCLFSYDAGQMLSSSEKLRNTSGKIDTLCADHIYKLTNKIRTNKELALFITCLRDLSKYRSEYSFPNVKILFEPKKCEALEAIKKLEMEGYTFISYTPSLYNYELNYQSSQHNTHNVIGQEFDGVCMLIDDHLYYTPEGRLAGKLHPNPDYLFEQLLYQGLTRVRRKIALVVTSEEMLCKILPLMGNN